MPILRLATATIVELALKPLKMWGMGYGVWGMGYKDDDTGNVDDTDDDTDDYTEVNYTTHLPDAKDDVKDEKRGTSTGCLVALAVLGLLLFLGFWITRSL